MKNGVCPKCDGTIIVQGVRVIDRSQGGVQQDLSVAVYSNPNAWLFKGQVMTELWACVCGVCGFTELYATNPDALVKAAVTAQTLELPPEPETDKGE
jgi:predicted nucleic-acid-binding Zn-ribbon protein